MKDIITVTTIAEASLEKTWHCWVSPEHITKWNYASDDWHCPSAFNDLREGGSFTFTMAAKDGSFSFDFGGTYTSVEPQQRISYIMDDGREATVWFELEGNAVKITEKFQAENIHSPEMQEAGWQAILNNFKKYIESAS